MIDLNKLKIKRVNDNDINEIITMQMNAWSHETNVPSPEFLKKLFIHEFKKRWKKRIANNVVILLINHHNTQAGFITYKINISDQPSNSFIEIKDLFVIPSLRRQGLGKKLCLAVINEMKKNKVHSTVTWIPNNQPELSYFFKKMGFSKTSKKQIADIALIETQYQLHR